MLIALKGRLDERSPIAAFLGGTLSDDRQIQFAHSLGRVLAERTRLRICVTGYKGGPKKDNPTTFRPAFGYEVAMGAAAMLDEESVASRLITSSVKTSKGAPRTFEIGSVKTPKGRNERSRRLSIVSEADVLCLAGGGSGTREVFDFARALDQPVLPLPFFMGSSREIWGHHQSAFARDFGMDDRTCQRWLSVRVSEISRPTLEELAQEVADTLVAGVRKRCLVCMPFAEHFEWVFDTIVQPAGHAACVDLVRLDLENAVGDISSLFRGELAKADCVLAIVTGERANVLYEVGFAHASATKVVLLCQKDPRSNEIDHIPLYLRNHQTIWYPDRFDEQGIAEAQEQLCLTLRKVGKSSIETPSDEIG